VLPWSRLWTCSYANTSNDHSIQIGIDKLIKLTPEQLAKIDYVISISEFRADVVRSPNTRGSKHQTMPFISSFPLPLPLPMSKVWIWANSRKEWQTWGNLYMAGELRVNRHNGNTSRRPRPLFLHTFFKIPIATQVIFLLALLGFFLKGDRAAAALRREESSYWFPCWLTGSISISSLNHRSAFATYCLS
jgi:hypothetical protein